MRISDWSSDVCSSDLEACARGYAFDRDKIGPVRSVPLISVQRGQIQHEWAHLLAKLAARSPSSFEQWSSLKCPTCHPLFCPQNGGVATRTEEHTSELQSLMRISYAVFCLKKPQ